MASFKTAVACLLVAAYRIEAGVAPLGVAPAYGQAFAPAPVAYANIAPYNIPPFAASVNAYTRSLALPVPLPAAGVLPPYAAPALAPVPAIAPGIAPLAPGFGPAFGPAFARASPSLYASGYFGTPYAAFPPSPLPVGRSIHAVAPGYPDPAIYGALPAGPVSAYQGVLPAPIL